MHLLFRLFDQELCFSYYLFTLLQRLFDLTRLLQYTDVVAIGKLFTLLLEKFGANFSLLVKFFCLQLHVNEVCIFKKAGKLVHFGLLQDLQLLVEGVEKVNYTLAQLVFQVEFLTLRDLLPTLH